MKKYLAVAAFGFASVGSSSAQSLFDLAPDLAEEDSFPLRWSAGVGVGYDDNATPLSGAADKNSTLFANAYVGASLLNNTPQTTTEFFARVGVIHYFDDLDTAAFDVEETTPELGLGFNWTNRISERLRFVSRNYVRFERQPDFTVGNITASQIGSYLSWSSENAIGYRWTDRLATYTGFTLSGIDYEESGIANDVFSWSIHNQFRYQLSQASVLTFTTRYTESDVDGTSRDSENIFLLAGIEHRLSPNSVFTLNAGAQLRDIDGGDSSSSPYVEAAIRSQINENFRVRGYVRYGIEDYNRFLNGNVFDDSETLRVGFRGDYRVSQSLSLNAGVNYIQNSYTERVGGGPDVDEDLLNLYVGFALRVADGVSVVGGYNYEDFSSDLAGADRDYDRNRFNLGLNAEF